jgi:hypothetical protein
MAEVVRTGVGALLALACTMAEVSCQRSIVAVPDAAAARRAMVAYFECEDCIDGELAAVVRFGPSIVSSLAATLRGGPPPASREIVRSRLARAYGGAQDPSWRPSDDPNAWNQGEYVQHFLDNYVALYQSRAALALGAIGGPNALRALEEAARLPLREDVLETINDLLK